MPTTISYIPRTLPLQVAWGLNFGSHLASVAAGFGITNEEVNDMIIGPVYSDVILKFRAKMKLYCLALTAFKDNSVNAVAGGATEMMAMPTLEPPPPGWRPGWHTRSEGIVSRMKSNTEKMDSALMKLLAIENTVVIENPLTAKPEVKCKLGQGSFPLLYFTLHSYDGAEVFVANAEGIFEYLGTSTNGKYLDKTALPAPGFAVVRKYKLIFLIENEHSGLFSDVINFTVTGV